MDLTRKSEIKKLLKKYNAKPKKYLGQHFILSKKPLAKMIAAAEIKKNDIIIEIGPGLGALTQELAKIPHPSKRGGGLKIIAVEKDLKMVSILKETLTNYKNIKIIQADARQSLNKPTRSPTSGGLGISGGKNEYKIVANLPYNAATFLIRQWLESENPPELMVLMIQKEVAKRICSKPPHMNLLAVSTQFLATAKVIDYVPAESFWPKPKVDAAIIKLIPKKNDCNQPTGFKHSFFKVAKAGFSQPRKQLASNLSKKLNIPREKIQNILEMLDVPEKARAENLSLEDWTRIAKKIDAIFSAKGGSASG